MDDKARILVVDADAQSLRATSQLLRRAGYQILEATSGEQGWRLAAEHRPELLLVAVTLPDVDGIELCWRLKAAPALSGSLVVLLSASKTSSVTNPRSRWSRPLALTWHGAPWEPWGWSV